MLRKINFELNGVQREVEIDDRESLLEVLRYRLELTGAKEGCGVGECGGCTVIIDGANVDSCIYLGVWADGKKVTTIEGIEKNSTTLSPIQENFIKMGAVQCGFCTPGLVMSSTVLLKRHKFLTREQIRRGISGNLCRCTGYNKVVNAIEETAKSS